MSDKIDSGAFHNSRNHNAVQTRGYGKPTHLSTNSSGHDLERSVPIMGALYNEDGFRGGDEFSRQVVKLPCQNASQIDRQNHYDGSERVKLPINSEFDDLGEKREDYTNIDSLRGSNASDKLQQLANSDGESKINTGTLMVLSERSKKIRAQLVPLLRVNSLEGNARAEKKPCRLVLPNDRPKIWKNEAVACQVSASDDLDGVQGYCNNLPIVVETIMKPNRCNVANSLGFKLYDKDQEDYISYIREELFCYIDYIKDYGFDHIIIIGELDYGMLFLDCFGRAFNLDYMTDTLLFLGDYFKRVERVTKGLGTVWVPWMINFDDGNIVEANGPEHYLLPFKKKRMKEKRVKKKNKKSSGKKHY